MIPDINTPSLLWILNIKTAVSCHPWACKELISPSKICFQDQTILSLTELEHTSWCTLITVKQKVWWKKTLEECCMHELGFSCWLTGSCIKITLNVRCCFLITSLEILYNHSVTMIFPLNICMVNQSTTKFCTAEFFSSVYNKPLACFLMRGRTRQVPNRCSEKSS